jgi:3-hydroxyacyl-[acyl-carrier-protein] dehydratase
MLQNDLFTFSDLLTEDDTIKTNVKLNPTHPIFEGHFPDQPLLPGACMFQILKETLEHHMNKKTRLVKAADLKFLSIIRPEERKIIKLEFKTAFVDELIRVDAKLLDSAEVLFKFKGFFREVI